MAGFKFLLDQGPASTCWMDLTLEYAYLHVSYPPSFSHPARSSRVPIVEALGDNRKMPKKLDVNCWYRNIFLGRYQLYPDIRYHGARLGRLRMSRPTEQGVGCC